MVRSGVLVQMTIPGTYRSEIFSLSTSSQECPSLPILSPQSLHIVDAYELLLKAREGHNKGDPVTFGKARGTAHCCAQLRECGANSTMWHWWGGCFLILTKVSDNFSPGRDTRVLRFEN